MNRLAKAAQLSLWTRSLQQLLVAVADEERTEQKERTRKIYNTDDDVEFTVYICDDVYCSDVHQTKKYVMMMDDACARCTICDDMASPCCRLRVHIKMFTKWILNERKSTRVDCHVYNNNVCVSVFSNIECQNVRRVTKAPTIVCNGHDHVGCQM